MDRRVVITGIGAVTPIGTGRQEFWAGVAGGRLGIRRVTLFDASGFRCQVAAEVPAFDPTEYMESKRAKRLDRYSQFAVAGARLALADAALDLAALDRERVGCCIGSALGGVAFAEQNYQSYARGGL